jgi:hypothetical protein
MENQKYDLMENVKEIQDFVIKIDNLFKKVEKMFMKIIEHLDEIFENYSTFEEGDYYYNRETILSYWEDGEYYNAIDLLTLVIDNLNDLEND